MRPRKHETTGSGDLFRARLDQIINMRHELVQLAGKIDWDFIDGEIAPLYRDSGRPGIATRFVIGLFLLKHIYGLSDEGACERWVYDPVFPALHWRGVLPTRVSARALGPEPLAQAPRQQAGTSPRRELAGGAREQGAADEGFGAGHGRYHRAAQEITFPTDAKLLHAAIKGLTRLARKHGVRLRQSYLRIAKRAAMMAGRYAHAKQFNRHRRHLRVLGTRLGPLIRDIRRKIAGYADPHAAFGVPLARADQIRSQQQRQRGWKLYSFHAPEVECIGKGKASAPYEFGVKASVVTTNALAPGGQF